MRINKRTGVPTHIEYYQRHSEKIKQKAREWRRNNKSKVSLQRHRYYEKSKGANKQIKAEALTYYGGGVLACIRCGFSDVRALTLDHIVPIGTTNRHKSGVALYRQLIKRGYPMGYQTLCANCQLIKMFEGNEWTCLKARK